MKKDIVKITNYGTTYYAERTEEIKNQHLAMVCCMGAERERATYVYEELLNGAKEINGDNY